MPCLARFVRGVYRIEAGSMLQKSSAFHELSTLVERRVEVVWW